MADPVLKLKVQLLCGEEIAMGPGKADLLDAIQEHGSISAAGGALGMCYCEEHSLTGGFLEPGRTRFATVRARY